MKKILWESENTPKSIRKWGIMIENKINELVDAVNTLQERSVKENLTDVPVEEKFDFVNNDYVSNCCGAEIGEECNGIAMCLECKEWCEIEKVEEEPVEEFTLEELETLFDVINETSQIEDGRDKLPILGKLFEMIEERESN